MRNKVSNALVARAIVAQNKAQETLSDTVVCAAQAAKIAEGTTAADATKATVTSSSKALDKQIVAQQAMQDMEKSI